MSAARSQRQQQIVLLERTLSAFTYEPPTWTGSLVQRLAKSGEGPTSKIDCPDCDGEGTRRIRGIATNCEACGARGKIVVDAYTERKVGTMEQELVDQIHWVRCDSCGGPRPDRAPGIHGNGQPCIWCADSGRPGYVRAPGHPIRPWRELLHRPSLNAPELSDEDPVVVALNAGMPGVGRAYKRRVLAGSYEELGLALGVLRLERRELYRLNVVVFIEADLEEHELRNGQREAIAESLYLLDGLMPGEIRVPSWAARFEQRRRDKVSETRGEEAA